MSEYNIRNERSNAGVTALATSFLSKVFNLTPDLTDKIMTIIQSSGEAPMLRRSLKLLSVVDHTRLNAMIGDDVEINQSEYEDTQPDDELDDVDSEQSEDEVDIPVVDSGDYDDKSRGDNFRESSFSQFLENAIMNAKLNNAISSDMDSELDPVALKKIKSLEMKGQKDAAMNVRKQASRKAQSANGGATRPTQRRVLAKKKELARAIQADKDAAAKEESGNV